MTTWNIDPDVSTVELVGKSSLHPIHAKVRSGSVEGTFEVTLVDGEVDVTEPTSGHVELPLTSLSFGNALYDRELPKRLQTARFPTVSLDLQKLQPSGPGTYQAELHLGLHGSSMVFEETVHSQVPEEGTLVVSGEHRFDVRQFGVEPPRMLGMKVHPDFTVTLSLTARRAG